MKERKGPSQEQSKEALALANKVNELLEMNKEISEEQQKNYNVLLSEKNEIAQLNEFLETKMQKEQDVRIAIFHFSPSLLLSSPLPLPPSSSLSFSLISFISN